MRDGYKDGQGMAERRRGERIEEGVCGGLEERWLKRPQTLAQYVVSAGHRTNLTWGGADTRG